MRHARCAVSRAMQRVSHLVEVVPALHDPDERQHDEQNVLQHEREALEGQVQAAHVGAHEREHGAVHRAQVAAKGERGSGGRQAK